MSNNVNKGNTVELEKGVIFEADVLTALTEPGAMQFARDEFLEFVTAKWGWDSDKNKYVASTRADKREQLIFDGFYYKMALVLACDKKETFKSAEALYQFALDNPTGFDKVYRLVIKANPTFAPVSEPKEKEKEGKEQDPN